MRHRGESRRESRALPQSLFAPLVAALVTTLFSLGAVGCSISPAKDQVRIEIQEEISDTEKDRIVDKLEALTNSRWTTTKTMSVNRTVTIMVEPVSDVKAFAESIQFGKVVEVKEAKRTILLSVRE